MASAPEINGSAFDDEFPSHPPPAKLGFFVAADAGEVSLMKLSPPLVFFTPFIGLNRGTFGGIRSQQI
ncbi:MAG: hypothetical protein D6800_02430 [Candidatus Zixiibacteriota bacterium]|nr:MAG: hypothetical protein D6800_02430 [candidate division Zixibacteria bacterium]